MRIIFALALLFSQEINAKVRILAIQENPLYLELQDKTFKKFFEEDYELFVFHGVEGAQRGALESMCSTLSLPCIRVPEDKFHRVENLLKKTSEEKEDSSEVEAWYQWALPKENLEMRRSILVQYALDHYGYAHDNYVILLDGDMFPIKPIRFKRLFKRYEVIGIQKFFPEEGIGYFSPVFTAFQPKKMKDAPMFRFSPCFIHGDLYGCGSSTYEYLKNHPQTLFLKVDGELSFGFQHWTTFEMKTYGLLDNEIWLIRHLSKEDSVEFYFNEHFLHLRACLHSLACEKTLEEFFQRLLN